MTRHVEHDWARLYREAFPELHRALTAVLLDGERALDALHDAFVEGLRRPPEHDQNIVGWIYRVALRKARRDRWPAFRVRDTTGLPDPELARVLDRLEVGWLLRQLTERQRSVVVARYFLGLPHEEISRVLGMRKGTVSATLNQAVTKMRNEVRQSV
jgi:RNA polymerase sigma factor (sigma-70 family)